MNSKPNQKTPGKSKLYFRKFSRKKFAVFTSMHRVVHISSLAIGYTLISSPLQGLAQSDTSNVSKVIDLEEVEIVGSKNPTLFEELPRMVSIVPQSEISSAPAQSYADLLRYSGNIDIRQRGKFSTQTDVSIRGGSFDQSLILFNGIPISDPQTGHLSLNLPVESDALNRIEVLNGPAARVHGTNAFSGAINFVSTPTHQNSAELQVSAGDYGFYQSVATLNQSGNKYKQMLHAYFGKSDGFATNTDFGKEGLYYHGVYLDQENRFDIQFGYSMREFGANGYYTPKYPDQFEKNQMIFFSAGYKTGKRIKVAPDIYWRRHRDRFELFREGTEWYKMENGLTISNRPDITAFDTVTWYSGHNHHINDVIGARLNLSLNSSLGTTTVGWHIRSENIISTNIGYDKGLVIPVRGYDNTFYTKADNRANFDMNMEQTIELHPFYVAAGFLINWNSYLPDEMNVFPGIDIRYEVLKNLHLIASYNYTLGLPTFTDLTYEDPNNVGNNELEPYTMQSIEGGIKILHGRGLTTLLAFYNAGNNVIDWVWFSDNSRYMPVNINEYSANGFELNTVQKFSYQRQIPFSISSLRLSYAYIDMHKELPENVAKYYNLHQRFSAMINQSITARLSLAWNINYSEREGGFLTYNTEVAGYEETAFSPYWLLDARVSYSFKWLTVYAEATNLLDTQYIDIGSIYQPGRWVSAGIKINFTKSAD